MSGDVERVAAELHPWLDGAPTCPYRPMALCPNHTRSRGLAQILLAPGGVVAGLVAEAEQRPCIHDRVEASSLGTPEAKAARESVPDDRVRHVVTMSRMYAQGRAEGAAEVRARVESALDEMATWCGPYGHQGVVRFVDRRDAHIRAALAAEPAQNSRNRPQGGRRA
jgi:hypothetical protein